MEAYGALTEHLRRIAALEQVAGILNWDQETQMPPKGAGQRAEQAGAVAAAIHAQASDPRIPDWIAAAGPQDGAGAVNLAEAARLHGRAVKIPPALAAELARASVEGQTAWEVARAADAFAGFAPVLARLVALKREEAACLATEGQSGYDALLDDYEPGMTTAGAGAAVRAAAARAGRAAGADRGGGTAGGAAGGAVSARGAARAVAAARGRVRL